MKKRVIKSVMVMGAVLTVIGCGSGSSSPLEETSDVQSWMNTPTSELSQELTDTLSYMGNEERLAYDVYNALDEQYPDVKQFKNIATNGEYQHISLVQQLIQKYKLNDDVNFTNIDLEPLGYVNTEISDMQPGVYDILAIQELYDNLVSQGSTSKTEALKVGCIIEVVDIIDLDAHIELAEKENAADIVEVFQTLRNGSYNHYWAFDGALKNEGGCCPVALEIIGGTVCPDYPKK